MSEIEEHTKTLKDLGYEVDSSYCVGRGAFGVSAHDDKGVGFYVTTGSIEASLLELIGCVKKEKAKNGY